MGPLWWLPVGLCVCMCVRKCQYVRMYVCVCFVDWRGAEIYLSEQRRIGDREESGEGCVEKKKE